MAPSTTDMKSHENYGNKKKYLCTICGNPITQREFEKNDGKCQKCWVSQLSADLEEMFEDLDAELVLRGQEY